MVFASTPNTLLRCATKCAREYCPNGLRHSTMRIPKRTSLRSSVMKEDLKTGLTQWATMTLSMYSTVVLFRQRTTPNKDTTK